MSKYEQPSSTNDKVHNAFIHPDTNRELQKRDLKSENKNPPTYIEKDGKIIPINLTQYRREAKQINKAAEQKRKEIEEVLRRNSQK